MIIAGLVGAAVAAAVTIVTTVTGRPGPACACTAEYDLRRPAHDTAVRFEALVRRADLAGAWALLSDDARARYAGAAGFRPVLDRLGQALGRAGGEDRAAADGWLAVDDRVRFDGPSAVVVVRHEAGPPQRVWPLLVLVPLGRPGEERVDPEPARLPLSAVTTGAEVRIETPDGNPDLTTIVAIDATGRVTRPARSTAVREPGTGAVPEPARSAAVPEPGTGGASVPAWSTPVRGPVTFVAIERNRTGVRLGVAAVGQAGRNASASTSGRPR